MKKQNSDTQKGKKVIWIFAGLLIILIAGGILFWHFGGSKTQNQNEGPVEESGSQAEDMQDREENSTVLVKIATPYCELGYPVQWKDYLQYEEDTEEDRFSVTFYCNTGKRETRLFTVHMGSSGLGDLVGQLEESGEVIKVYVEMYDLELDDTMTEKEKTTVYAMAEGVNDVIKGLSELENYVPVESPGAISDGASGDFLKIVTPYCVLEYPSRWKDFLSYEDQKENDVYSLKFYCNMSDKQIELFTVYFGAPETGDLIGYITKDGTKNAFSVKAADLTSEDGWTEEEADIIYAMGECINDVVASVNMSEEFWLFKGDGG